MIQAFLPISLFLLWCPGPDSNRHGISRGILSPLRLPISPPGHDCGNRKQNLPAPRPPPSGNRKDSTAPAAWAEFSADIWRVTDWQFNGFCILGG